MNTIHIWRKVFFAGVTGTAFLFGPLVFAEQPSANDLRNSLQQLQTQLQLLENTKSGSGLQGFQFIHTLYRGVTDNTSGNEVSKLQQLLSEEPDVYPQARVTGYFGQLTEAAVGLWQTKHHVVSSGSPETTGYGVVGPKTRTELNLVLSARHPALNSESVPIAPIFGLSNSGDIYISRPTSGTVSATSSVNIYLPQHISSNINFAMSGLPVGVNIATPASCNDTCTRIITVAVTPDTPIGTYTLIVTATTPGTSGTTALNLTINNAPVFHFTVSNSGNIVIEKPLNGTTVGGNTITVTLTGGPTNRLTFTQSGLPTGGTAPTLPACNPTCAATNNVTIRTNTPVGTYPIIVKATAGTLIGTTIYNLIVTERVPFNFNLTVSNNIIITRPSYGAFSATNVISAARTSGAGVPITFTQTGFPAGSGVTALQTCTPTCDNLNTITVNSSTPFGTYPITVTATGGGASRTITYNLTVSP